MDIELSFKNKKYNISSDINGYTIVIYMKAQKEDAKHEYNRVATKYASSMTSVVDILLESHIRLSDAKTLSDLINEMARFKTSMINELYGDAF